MATGRLVGAEYGPRILAGQGLGQVQVCFFPINKYNPYPPHIVRFINGPVFSRMCKELNRCQYIAENMLPLFLWNVPNPPDPPCPWPSVHLPDQQLQGWSLR